MIDALRDCTYMVRHNPNCPKRFEVRLTGMGLLVAMGRGPSMKFGDAVGYGDTAEEAAANTMAAKSDQEAQRMSLSLSDMRLPRGRLLVIENGVEIEIVKREMPEQKGPSA